MRAMAASAASVGVPATAAVGCSTSMRSSTEVSAVVVASTSVARCHTFGRARVNGCSLAARALVSGESASTRLRTAYPCSSRSFALDARASAASRSLSGSAPRATVPASTRAVTVPSETVTRVSGLAPIRPCTAYTHVSG